MMAPKVQAKVDLKILLRKLGLKSASYVTGTLTEQDLIKLFNQAQTNFGVPDGIIMNPRAFNAYKKLLK